MARSISMPTPSGAQAGPRDHIDFDAVNAAALRSLPELLSHWLSDGKMRGHEFVARNPRRADRNAGSFSVNVRTGRWADFATGDKGADPIALAAYLHDLSQLEAARRIAGMLGLGTGASRLALIRRARSPSACRGAMTPNAPRPRSPSSGPRGQPPARSSKPISPRANCISRRRRRCASMQA